MGVIETEPFINITDNLMTKHEQSMNGQSIVLCSYFVVKLSV